MKIMDYNCKSVLQKTNRKLWVYLICSLLPVILSPLAFSPYKESKCAYVLLLVASYWLLEPAHVTATAFIPIILFPILGVVSSSEVCDSYMIEAFMIFIGGIIVAIAIEDSKLHERIALKALLLIGTELKWLMMSFMLTTMFLSMWINNMSATVMMVPIVEAVIEEMSKSDEIEIGSVGCCQTANEQMKSQTADHHEVTKKEVDRQGSSELYITKVTIVLSVCYAANIGGTGSLTGCGPNIVLVGLLENLHPLSSEITFASWMMYSVPGMVLCVLIAWIYLWVIYIRQNEKNFKMQSGKNVKVMISRKYDNLGSMSFREMEVVILFLILVFLWIFREPKFIAGWVDLIGSDRKIGDSAPAILIAFLLFFLPVNPRDIGGRPILEWKTAQSKMPWGVIILAGGGFALANAAKKSGLSRMIAAQLSCLSVLPPGTIVALMCFITAMLTELISNTPVSTILLPVINEMAVSIGVNPLYLMMPVTAACSYAFMLPVACPPNALVFESSNMRILDMAKPGLVMNLVCCSVQLIMINTLGVFLFDLNTFPSWANKTENFTSSTAM